MGVCRFYEDCSVELKSIFKQMQAVLQFSWEYDPILTFSKITKILR